MTKTLAFDVYGTLIDTHGLVERLAVWLGDRAPAFSQLWRDKQLEYSFRRGLMRRYATFAVCTAQALDYSCEVFGISMSAEEKTQLLADYRQLPAFPDAQPALEQLKAQGHALYAFSNGAADAVESLLQHAGIRDCFDDVISVDEVGSFKPNPEVYQHMLKRTNAKAGDAWLISSNPFDVIGANGVGINSAWVKRSAQAVFDPWDLPPTVIIESLEGLAARV